MTETVTRVLIADDMKPIREYLKMVLGNEPDVSVTATVGSGSEAVRNALSDRPDVVLMDLEMETPRAGVEAIRTLSQHAPEVRCVVLTHFGDDETVFAAFEAGARDYLLKSSSAVDIIESVRAAREDRSPIRPRIAKMILAEFRNLRAERAGLVATLNTVYKLTPTELALLRLLAEGHSQAEICKIRHVAASTVRTHVANILRKFEEGSVQNVVSRLRRLGIFDLFSPE